MEVLKSSETTAGERAEENGEPRTEGVATQPCQANLRVRVEREPERACQPAPRQSEVIRPRHSSRIAEERTGSYRASTLKEH